MAKEKKEKGVFCVCECVITAILAKKKKGEKKVINYYHEAIPD